jgi:hypothetical protein
MFTKRKDIRGFTIKAFGYSIEFVTRYHWLRIVALWQDEKTGHGPKLIKRIDW